MAGAAGDPRHPGEPLRLSPRAARFVRGISAILVAGGLVTGLRALPLDGVLARLHGMVGTGAPGMAAFGAAYVVAALALVPGAALTLAAGTLLGPLRGVIVVSLASTTAAALAFLIARHLARRRVEALASRYRMFRAVDRAIAEGGWKVVGLLRLSPAMPFSVENYVFGLTAVGFWPYVLASWLFMLPGTVLYVSLGHAGRAAAAGARSEAEWLLLAAGLAATAGVTAYLTRLARRALAEQSLTDAPPLEDAVSSLPARQGIPVALPIAALVAVALGVWAHSNRASLRSLAGPPLVLQGEAYAAGPESTPFDHSAFDALLKRHVRDGGFVDYQGLLADSAALDAYLAQLESAPFDTLNRDEKLALLINAYDAFTLRLILDRWPVSSIKDIPSGQRWDARRWRLAGRLLSLNQIEHEEIRPKFREPRVHFALVCAARGCPPLRREAYVGARLADQLEDQARYVHSHDRWFRWDPATDTAHLTELYRWYGGDFEQLAGSVMGFVARYSPPVRSSLEAGRRPQTRWIRYDWSLNGKASPSE